MKKINIDNKKPAKRLALLWLIIGVFVVSIVFITIQSATMGAELAVLEEEERLLIKERQELSSRIIKSQSLTTIKEQSVQLGFIRPSDTLYFSQLKPLGLKQ